MVTLKRLRSLRSSVATVKFDEHLEMDSSLQVTAACLVTGAPLSGAEMQEPQLPPITVDGPVTRPRRPAAKPTPEQIRVPNALRRRARERQAQTAAPKPAAGALAPDRDPYANPAAPYMANRLASPLFAEPVVNAPHSRSVLTKDVLEDKHVTALKEVGRGIAGVILGTGERGSAAGDQFFICGFDGRGDVFIDGPRDPAVSLHENLDRTDRHFAGACVNLRRSRYHRRRNQHRHQAGHR